jgi:hypothetical protein
VFTSPGQDHRRGHEPADHGPFDLPQREGADDEAEQDQHHEGRQPAAGTAAGHHAQGAGVKVVRFARRDAHTLMPWSAGWIGAEAGQLGT